jgi:hypothetical protein
LDWQLAMACPRSRGHVTNFSRKFWIDFRNGKHGSNGCGIEKQCDGRQEVRNKDDMWDTQITTWEDHGRKWPNGPYNNDHNQWRTWMTIQTVAQSSATGQATNQRITSHRSAKMGFLAILESFVFGYWNWKSRRVWELWAKIIKNGRRCQAKPQNGIGSAKFGRDRGCIAHGSSIIARENLNAYFSLV